MTSNLEDSAQLGHRLAVFIDPDVHAWIFLVGVNNERGALAPALVAAGRLPRLQHRDQPFRQVERRLVEESLRHRLDRRLADQHVALHSIVGSGEVAEPCGALRPAPRRAAAGVSATGGTLIAWLVTIICMVLLNNC